MSTEEKMTEKDAGVEALARERYELLQRLEDWLNAPMVVLAFVWVALLAVELIWGETPASEILFTFIWIIFILNFILEFILAPQKIAYLKSNWLTAISVLVPGLRIFRAFRAVRVLRLAKAGRSLNLFRLVSSLNRGMKALAASLSRRGFGYVLMLTAMVVITGAAGMYAFENVPGGLNSYGEALWWTAMIMMTMGSQYWPQTTEGRVLCFILALYAFAVFGYMTAAFASFFIGRDAESDAAEVAGARQITDLREEVRGLRDEIRTLVRQRPEG